MESNRIGNLGRPRALRCRLTRTSQRGSRLAPHSHPLSGVPHFRQSPSTPPGDGSHPHALTLVTQPHKQLATSSPFSLHRSSPRRDTKASGLVPPPPLQPSDPGGSSRKRRPAHRDPRLQVPRWLPGAPSMKAKPLGVAPWSCGADLTPARPHPAGSASPPHRHTPATPAPSSPSKSQATSALSALSW